MDDFFAAEYSEPCARCSELQWGITDEGQFFCQNCHNVIERTQEVVEPGVSGVDRVTTLHSGPRVKRAEGGRQWMVCEGFQFILKSQAEALVNLGVDPGFKDEVLVHLWRLYLQKTHQAYTHTPVRCATFRLRDPRSDSETGLSSGSGLESESGLSALDSQVSGCDSDGALTSTAGSVCSGRSTRSTRTTGSTGELSDWSLGSLDSDSYLSPMKRRRSHSSLMSMRKTLALLHVALTWSRQSLTLSDLLRLVEQGHVPYVNSYECFPEEMKLSNRDALIFRVLSVPSYQSIHRESKDLIKLLHLPAFPPISIKSPLHPLNISLRLLTDLNLPDQLASLVESVLEQADLMRTARLTCEPRAQGKLPHYELIAAAAIIISMKLLFGLDDHTEWELSSDASSSFSEPVFNLRRWYRLLQRALLRGQRRALRLRARKQWVPKKPFYFTYKDKVIAMKRRRVTEQLTASFTRLSSDCHGDTQRGGACGFHFLWGRSPDADGWSMHHMTLKGGARTDVPESISEKNYWHQTFKHHRASKSHLEALQQDLPRSFVWLLRLCSFLVGVQPYVLLEAVLSLERKLLRRRGSQRPRRKKQQRSKQSRESEEEQQGE